MDASAAFRTALTADTTLAALAAGGDRAAFGELARRYAGTVQDLMRRMGADHSLAEDLTQDAFLAAWRAVGSWRGEGGFGAWVRTIAARLYLKRRRKEARLLVMAEPIDPRCAADLNPLSGGARIDLDAALASLSPAERLCVSLNHGAGLTHEEISLALRTPLGTVKSHVLRGLEKLRRRLGAG